MKAIKDFRRYRQTIQSYIDKTRADNKIVHLSFPIDEHPLPVFEQCVSKIGFLPADLASEVTKFYSYARSVVQDFRMLYSDNLQNWPLPDAVHLMEEMIRITDIMDDLATKLIPKLREEAERPW